MKSSRDHVTSGLKNIGFDGGLDTKSDPIQVVPPKTTTCDNAWYISTSQLRGLPTGTTSLLPSSANCHQVTSTALGTQGVVAIQDMPVSVAPGVALLGHTQPQLVDAQNPGIPLSATPAYQNNFKTRIFAHTAAPVSQTTPDFAFVTPDAAVNGLQPFALVAPNYGPPGLFTVTTGDLLTGSTSPTTLNYCSTLTGASSATLTTWKLEIFPGSTTYFLLLFQISGSSNLYAAIMPYANPGYGPTATPPTVFTVSTSCASFNSFVENQKLWVATLSTGSGGTVSFTQIGTTGIIGTARTGVTVSGLGNITARYCNGVGLFYVYATTSAATLYTIDDSVWQAGNTTTAYTGALYSGTVDNTAVTIGINKLSTSACGSIFMHIPTAMTGSTSLANYGVGQPTINHIAIINFGTSSTTTTAGITLQPLYFQLPVGCNILAECFTPNYSGPGGTAGNTNSGDVLCPITLNYHYSAISGANVFTQPKYYLINSMGNIVSRWGDDEGGAFYPSAQPVLRKTCAVIAPSDDSSLDFHIPFTTNSQLQSDATTPTSGMATYLNGGFPTFNMSSPCLATWSTQAQKANCPPVVSGRGMVFGGPLTSLYDGTTLHEAGFHARPRAPIIGTVTASTASSGITITYTSGSATATVNNSAYLFVNQSVSGTGIPSGTTILDINNQTITLSNAATATGSTTLSTTCQYQYIQIYEWTDAQGLLHRSAPSLPTQVNFVSTTNNLGSVNLALPLWDQTYKLGGASVVWQKLYRTINNGTQFYNVSSTAINNPGQSPNVNNRSNMNTMGVFYMPVTDSLSDEALNNPIAAGTQVIEDILYTSDDGSYASFAPPPFRWQVTSGGRQFGLACVEGFNRIYFSQEWNEANPPEWNNFCYLPIPAELGDCRSLAAYQNNLVVFGTRGIATFSGSGPARQLAADSDGTVPDGASLNAILNTNFSIVTPIPTPAGVRGTGSPVTTPTGIVYQDRAGIMLLDSSFGLTYVGAGVEKLTGTLLAQFPGIIYGHGTLSESLQTVVFANPAGPALNYDYATSKFATWSAMSNVSRVVQSVDKSLFALKPTGVVAVNTFGSTLQVETAWLASSPSEPAELVSNTYSSSSGEGNIWETELWGTYLSPHTVLIETAINYGAYTQDTTFSFTAAPPTYQLRIRPQRTTRIWAIRYRITLTPAAGNTAEMARLGGLVIYSGVDTATTRVGRGFSQ